MNRYTITVYTRPRFVAATPLPNGQHVRQWSPPVQVKYLSNYADKMSLV